MYFDKNNKNINKNLRDKIRLCSFPKIIQTHDRSDSTSNTNITFSEM